jgi:hypothetical protein
VPTKNLLVPLKPVHVRLGTVLRHSPPICGPRRRLRLSVHVRLDDVLGDSLPILAVLDKVSVLFFSLTRVSWVELD